MTNSMVWEFFSGPVVAMIITGAFTPVLAWYLRARGLTVPDMHKAGRPPVPRPGGPAIYAGIGSGVALAAGASGNDMLHGVGFILAVVFLIGILDDTGMMRQAWWKPAGCLAAGLGGAVLGGYEVLFILPVAVLVTGAANAANMIDVMSGAVSFMFGISSLVMAMLLFGFGEPVLGMAMLALFGTCAVFAMWHAVGRIFPGDSGALVIGAAYISIAAAAGWEFIVVAIVGIAPIVFNAALYVMQFGIRDHHVVRACTEDMPDGSGRMRRTGNAESLVSLILRLGPMSEDRLVIAFMLLQAGAAVGAMFLAMA